MITPTRPDAPSARNAPLSAATSSCVGRPVVSELCLPTPLEASLSIPPRLALLPLCGALFDRGPDADPGLGPELAPEPDLDPVALCTKGLENGSFCDQVCDVCAPGGGR